MQGRKRADVYLHLLTHRESRLEHGTESSGTLHCRKPEEKQPRFSQATPQLKGDWWGAGEVERELNR